ncbi:aldehyde dehydrogenase family protein [Hoeflea sp. WL0058]|uniref:Aldehyde dehydrogenase family protein n=1 Tax=Flavimaribacter sediminis TaxID=2865987 RepID=A0AAE3D1M9_9HYPH|nr:aldehyde dehydrogenase family protein [Flavimaribacter sediminis]MBW8639039.1 aldehyde dehydrogenase family protein [Flavimaribacter sediminis]
MDGSNTILISNTWRSAENGGVIDVIAPAQGTVLAQIAAGGESDIDLAVAAARKAFEEGEWSRLTAAERGRLLTRAGDLVQKHAEELAELEAADTGKPIRQARADIAAAVRYFEYYGGAADKFHGETLPFMNGYLVATERVPHGVTGHIIPWNYPAQMFPRSIGPALATGNAVVMKPAEEACLTTLKMAQLCVEAGFPEGSINIVTGYGHEAGAALSGHAGIDFVSFIGSSEVGVLIQQAAARNHIGCTLELGGKSPQIVFGDVDMNKALPFLVNAIVQHAGQTCSAGSRLLVERKHYDEIVGTVADRFSQVRAGTPEMDHDLGPVVSRKQQQRVLGFASAAEAAGVPVIAEGKIADGVPDGGFFVAPRLFGPVPRESSLANDEVFGPYLSVMPFEDEADAIALANGTPYGLVAGIWTENGSRAMRVGRKMRVGQVFVNCYGAGGGIELPFGGMKKSGHGREKGYEALYEFTAVRTMVVKHD